MKYFSIDIETTGLDESFCQVLEIGAIFEDCNNLLPFETVPKFEAIIKPNGHIQGQPVALHMNARIIEILAKYEKLRGDEKVDFKSRYNIMSESEASYALYKFAFENLFPEKDVLTEKQLPLKINCAGKNFGTFDAKFLYKMEKMKRYLIFTQRLIDPAMLYVDWKNDETMPNMDTCKERAGIAGKVTHKAIEDAWDVILLNRKDYS